MLREDLDARLLSFFIFFLKNPSAKLLLAVDEQHPRQNLSGVAARTRVCSPNQTERGAASRRSSLGLLLKPLAALSTLPSSSCLSLQSKPPSTESHRTPIPIAVPSAVVVGSKKGSSRCLKPQRGKSGSGREPGRCSKRDT